MAMALRSWSQVYDDATLDRIVTPGARPAVAKIAQRCLYDPNQILASVPVTAQFVDDLCANGATVDHRVLPGVAHLQAGHEAAPGVAGWIADRFAGASAPDTCGRSLPIRPRRPNSPRF